MFIPKLVLGVGAIVALGTVAASCAGPNAVGPHDKRYRNAAYVYGRFVAADEVRISPFATGTPKFQIRCRDGRTFEIEFQRDDQVQVLALPVSTCQLENIIYPGRNPDQSALLVVAAAGDVRRTEMSSFRLLKNEILEPGGVYYVGDFEASAADAEKWGPHEWTLKSTDAYDDATEELRRTFVNFASARTEDRFSR